MSDLDTNRRLFGSYHPACGRVLRKYTAALEDEAMDRPPAPIEPLHHVIQGAQAYSQAKGLGNPHEVDYAGVRTHRGLLTELAHHYDQSPLNDPAAHKHFAAMAKEVEDQHHFMTHKMGIRSEVVDHDPYKDIHELRNDVANNGRIKVMGTHVTGAHPFFSNDQNDKFRAVHDVFGHLGTGRSFDRHGEEAAYQAHSRMFSHHALPAMASETRGQNGSLIVNGHFGPQHIALLPQHLWHPGLAHFGGLPTIDLYHHTDPETADTIHRTKQMTTPRGDGQVFFSTHPHSEYGEGFGPSVVHVRVPKAFAHLDDEFPNGEQHYWVHKDRLKPHHFVGIEHTSSLVDDYRWEQDAQNQRAEKQTGGYGRETGSYFGTDGEGDAQERRVNFKDYLKQRKGPEEGDGLSRHELTSYAQGVDLGERHRAMPSDRDVDEFHAASEKSTHPDHFVRGYTHGWDNAVQRVAILLGDAQGPADPVMRVVSHVSGNAINVLHCFAGETQYVTRDGMKTLAETSGTIQTVLTQNPETGESYWVDAPIINFGKQKLMKVSLRRNKVQKDIYATAGHRWIVRRPDRIVTTENLRPGHRLAYNVQRDAFDIVPSVEGIRSGVVFGDGYAHSNGRMAAVTLWGEKDKQLLQYFPCVDPKVRITPNGIHGVYLGGKKNGLHADMKLIPSMEESDEFLLGWLAGYFAADGTVSKTGQVIMHSSSVEHLEAVRDIAIRLGISVFGIQSKMRQGYGDLPTMIHQIQFVGSSVPESMILIEEHKNRFNFRTNTYERLGWTVVSVAETDRYEDVFCAVVPETETFTLDNNILSANCPFCGSGAVIARSDGTIECGYCTSVFTVQVQPAYNGFPQSVDGQEYAWPGQPDPADTLDPSVPPGTNLAPGANPLGGDPTDEQSGPPDSSDPADGGAFGSDEGEDDSDNDKPAFLKGKGDSGDSKSDDKKDKGKKGNPFAKKKSYRTAAGAELPVEEFLAHVAIMTSPDPQKTAQRVLEARGENGRL